MALQLTRISHQPCVGTSADTAATSRRATGGADSQSAASRLIGTHGSTDTSEKSGLRVLARRLLAAWRAQHGSALSSAHLRELSENLQAEKEALQAFTAAMEQEFLTLGTLLRGIASLAREVKDRSDEATAAAAGRTEDAARQFAFQLLKKAEDLVHAGREQHANVFRVFENMHLELRLMRPVLRARRVHWRNYPGRSDRGGTEIRGARAYPSGRRRTGNQAGRTDSPTEK